jgi:molybdopterin molybdotransferase
MSDMTQNQDMFVSFEYALDAILVSISPVDGEQISLKKSYGRILHEDIQSDINVPPFDNSAMDGFALKAAKTAGATESIPKQFIIAGEIQAGGASHTKIDTDDAAIRIMTGAPIPPGADAVVPVENTVEDATRGVISVFNELQQYENIRFEGEDIKTGQVVLHKGNRLSSADVGVLSALNRSIVSVYKKPKVAIISTGDEIAEVGDEIRHGQIRNSNAYTLQSEVEKYNGIPYYLGIARDSVARTSDKLLSALEYDIVITTGGVSQGKYDFIKEVLSDLGVNLLFDSIKMKPGKPMIFGKKNKTILFGLPGNPVSTMVSFIEFVRPALLAMSGSLKLRKPELNAISDSDIRKKPGRREYIRGQFSIRKGEVHVISTGSQGSGILRSMSMANCLIIMPEASAGCMAGETVTIQLIHHEEID